MLARFYDAEHGGFFDTEPTAAGAAPLAVLGTRRKPLQDSPTPSGNAVAASVLLRLHELTGREDLRSAARATLSCFAGVVGELGLFAASYGMALRQLLEPGTQVCVVGEDAAADELEAAALARFAANKRVIRLTQTQANSAELLPPALAMALPHLPRIPGSFAVVCSGGACQPPVTTREALSAALS